MYDTSYDGVAGHLVENPIDRYLINSTTQGLVRDADGSLTIHIRRDEPDTAAGRANWLPAPDGELYLAMRIYWPDAAALDGTWQPPPSSGFECHRVVTAVHRPIRMEHPLGRMAG